MARRSHDYRLRRTISIRLQLIIEERFGTLNGFLKAMEAQGKTALASTVRGWLPPQRLWKLKPNGRAVRRIDWEAVKIPDCSTLIEFCDVLSVRADFILLGEGVASRSQTRETKELAQDIAAHLAERLRTEGFAHWSAADVDGNAVLAEAVTATKKEAAFYSRLIETTPGRIIGRGGLLLDLIGELAAYLPETPEALAYLITLTNTGALLEASFESDFDFSKLQTRYLSFPDINSNELPLPNEAITERIFAALERREVDPSPNLELTAADEARLRAMLAELGQKRRKRRKRS